MATINYVATTTGLINPVILSDLGRVEITHPSTVVLTDIFDSSVLADSQSLQDAITSGHLVLTDNSGNQISQVEDIQLSVFSKTISSNTNALVKFSGVDGKTVEQTNLVSDSTGLNLTSGKFKINGVPLRVESLDNVVLTNLQNGDILEYSSSTGVWFNAQRKLSFEWSGYLLNNNVNSSVILNPFGASTTSSTYPFLAPFSCFIKAVTVGGLETGDPYLLDVFVNNTLVASYPRLSNSISNFYDGLFVQIPQGARVHMRMTRQGINVSRPYATLYIREL